MSACGFDFWRGGEAGNMFHDLPSHRMLQQTQLPQQVSTIKCHRTTQFNYICPWPIAHLSSVGHVLNGSQESLIHVKHDTTYPSGRDRRSGHSSHCRAIVPLIPSGLEGLIWGSTAGSIVIQCADGEKHGLFRSCCLFPASCNKMPQNYCLCVFQVDGLPPPDRTGAKLEKLRLVNYGKRTVSTVKPCFLRYQNCCVESIL